MKLVGDNLTRRANKVKRYYEICHLRNVATKIYMQESTSTENKV